APDVSERGREALEQRRDRLAAADLLRMLNAISEIEQRFRKSGQQQLLVETLLVRFALLDRAIELEDLLRSMGGSGGGSSSGRSGSGTSSGGYARTETRSVPRADGGSFRSEARNVAAPPTSGGSAAPRMSAQPAPSVVSAPALAPAPANKSESLDLNKLV